MPKKLLTASLIGLCFTLAAAFASVALTLARHERSLHERARAAALEVAGRYEEAAAELQTRMAHACASDVQVERVALELAAGGLDEADTSRPAQALARSLDGDVWILHQRGAALSVVGVSSGAPGELPQLTQLREATRPSAWDEAWIASCRRELGTDALWVLRVTPLSELRERFAPRDPAVGFTEDARGVLALHVPSVSEDDAPGEALELRVQASEAAPLSDLLPLLPLAALVLVFGGSSVYAFVSRRPIDDSVLVELERAAERVAQGDLTSRIGLRPGGRADQTFRTFDHMTAELSDMRGRLAEAERNAAFQDIAQRIAHELKNPLAPIQLAIETLRKAHGRRLSSFDEIFDESTRAILEEVRRMARIVREFGEFARLPKARPGMLELGAFTRDTLSLYAPEDVQLALLHTDEVMVRVDREQFAQVLINLVQNAVDAARDGQSPRVEVRVEHGDGRARLHVDDSGPGIPEGERERVFEPYFTTKEHGTGLGLAIVRRIVVDHQGTLQVSQAPLGGARFTIELPLC